MVCAIGKELVHDGHALLDDRIDKEPGLLQKNADDHPR